jgi:HEAT repeat protein
VTLSDAAAEADALAEEGKERELAVLRGEWDDEVEAAARSKDYRERAAAYRAIGQFRFRQKTELLRRGLEDESPACRGSALISLERLSRDHPSVVNSVRPLLHEIVARDGNEAVRRLAIVALRNGSAQRDTIQILASLGDDDEQERELREAATKIAQLLRRRAGPR